MARKSRQRAKILNVLDVRYVTMFRSVAHTTHFDFCETGPIPSFLTFRSQQAPAAPVTMQHYLLSLTTAIATVAIPAIAADCPDGAFCSDCYPDCGPSGVKIAKLGHKINVGVKEMHDIALDTMFDECYPNDMSQDEGTCSGSPFRKNISYIGAEDYDGGTTTITLGDSPFNLGLKNGMVEALAGAIKAGQKTKKKCYSSQCGLGP